MLKIEGKEWLIESFYASTPVIKIQHQKLRVKLYLINDNFGISKDIQLQNPYKSKKM